MFALLPSLLLLACHTREPILPSDSVPSFYGAIPRNLLVISIDTFRPDHLTRYGDHRELMPFLDGLISEGVTLDAHQSCSNWTYPGSQCAMDGYSALDLGQLPDATRQRLPEDRVTLSSTLSGAGYATVLATANPWQGEDTDIWHGFQAREVLPGALAEELYLTGRGMLTRQANPGRDPWFLHLHVMEPHTPYTAPKAYMVGVDELEPIDIDFEDQDAIRRSCEDWDDLDADDRSLLRSHITLRYAAELRHLDAQLAVMWADLKARGLLEDTLVVFWSDHGEQFFERGLCTHNRDLHREESDAIALFWADNIIHDAVSIPTTHADLAPTVLELLGVDIPEEMTGAPLSRLDPDRAVHSYADGNMGIIQTLVRRDMKLMYYWEEGTSARYPAGTPRELFDLAADPGEQVNLYDSDDPLTIELWELLMPEVERLDALREDFSPPDPGP